MAWEIVVVQETSPSNARSLQKGPVGRLGVSGEMSEKQTCQICKKKRSRIDHILGHSLQRNPSFPRRFISKSSLLLGWFGESGIHLRCRFNSNCKPNHVWRLSGGALLWKWRGRVLALQRAIGFGGQQLRSWANNANNLAYCKKSIFASGCFLVFSNWMSQTCVQIYVHSQPLGIKDRLQRRRLIGEKTQD